MPGCTGGLTNPAPGAEDAKLVIIIPVGLPCLERGRLYKKLTFMELKCDMSEKLNDPTKTTRRKEKVVL